MFCFIQTFTLTSRSLHLPVGGQLISSISFEMFGCQPFFFQKPGTWFSPSSGLSDSTFLILLQLFSTEECCSLSFSLTLSVHMSSSSILSSCFPDFFQGIILDKDILETTIRFLSFPGFPTIRMQLIS